MLLRFSYGIETLRADVYGCYIFGSALMGFLMSVNRSIITLLYLSLKSVLNALGYQCMSETYSIISCLVSEAADFFQY